MRVCFLSEGNRRQASADHRVYLIAHELESRGVSTSIETGTLRRIGRSVVWLLGPRSLARCMKALVHADVLVVHKTAGLGALVAVMWARLLGVRVVFDFDDAIHLPWKYGFRNPLYFHIVAVLRLASSAWCGSHFLQQFASSYTSAVLIPTPVLPAFSGGRGAKREADVTPVIVWMGNGRANCESLAILRAPLMRLARVSRFKFTILSALGSREVTSLFEDLASMVPVDFGYRDWRPATDIAARIAQCDIGVMPLRDSSWNRGKCAMKGLECMAAGLSVVLSDVGENRFVADSGRAALLATDEKSWYRHLRALVALPNYRRALSERGQERVQQAYSQDKVLELVHKSLLEVMTRRSGLAK